MKITRAFLLFAAALLLPLRMSANGPFKFYAVTPCRILDTRLSPGNPLVAGPSYRYRVVGICGVPLSATAVFLTVTVVSPTDAGYVVVYPNPGSFPGTSMVNVKPGERALANGAIIGVGTDAALQLSAAYETCGGQGTTHLVLDVMGYFTQ